ncbi:MAG: hypothetical protein H5T98_07390 [Syntrophomonadaceae bacterium]|nr:hypothetical protein [Syntrophomonadaceae bacterium]
MYKYSSPDFRMGNTIRLSRNERDTGLILRYAMTPFWGAVNRLACVYAFEQVEPGFQERIGSEINV